MFVNLHGYSTFSFLEAVGKPKDIIARAKSLWQTAIALTDQNVLYGAIQHYQAGEAEGIKPIIWTELGFVLDTHHIANEKNIWTLTLLALNTEGYASLLKLVSYAGQEGIAWRPKIDLATLQANSAGVLAFCGGPESRIGKMVVNGEPMSKIQEILDLLKSSLGAENLYLEIIAQEESSENEITQVNQAVLELSELSWTPCILSNIYYYPAPEDRNTQELAMAIKDNLKLYDPSHRTLPTINHIMPEAEIKKVALNNGYAEEKIDQRIKNTEIIADRCSIKIEMGQVLFPRYEGDDEIQRLYYGNQNSLIETMEL